MNRRNVIRIISLMMVLCLFGCTGYDSHVVDGGIVYNVSRNGKKAFVSDVYWDGDIDHTDIVIPEKVEKATVIALGGFYGTGSPSPFTIFCEQREKVGEDEDIPEEDVVFTIYVPKTVEDVKCKRPNPPSPVKKEDGSIFWYYPKYYFVVDEENPYLYAKEGKLYYVKDDSPVDTEGVLSYAE